MPKLAFALLAAPLALGACSAVPLSSLQEPPGHSVTPLRTEARPPKPPAMPCTRVSAAMRAAIAEGAERGVGWLRITRAAAVRASTGARIYLIAGNITAPGVKNEQGLWAANSLTPSGGVLMAVDGTAQEFTAWPDADKMDARISPAAPGVKEARSCLK